MYLLALAFVIKIGILSNDYITYSIVGPRARDPLDFWKPPYALCQIPAAPATGFPPNDGSGCGGPGALSAGFYQTDVGLRD